MVNYKGLSGKSYSTEILLGSGGEGEIYSISGDNLQVLKIYKKPSLDRENKLKVMIRSPLSKSQNITWPRDIVYDRSGSFCGYVMQRVHGGESINIVYEYGQNSKYPNISLDKRITIARNICFVLDSVHKSGQICGDFNPNNIFINMKSGHVKFVDTDSYHISDGSTVYRCTVGMPNYIPAEIGRKLGKGVNLSNAQLPTFSKESDNFALAVHIFQLLMNGAHPYQGAIDKKSLEFSMDVLTIPENIRRGVVPYINPNKPNLIIPVFAPPFESLPIEMQSLFRRAFLTGTVNPSIRPTPDEWYDALTDFSGKLLRCNTNTSHTYYNKLSGCPYCETDLRFSRAIGVIKTPDKKASNKSKKNVIKQKMPYSKIVDDSSFCFPNGDTIGIAKMILDEQSPIDEAYFIKLLAKMLDVKRVSSKMYSNLERVLRNNFNFVRKKDFVTYMSNINEYDAFSEYRVSDNPNYNRRIVFVSLPELENAFIDVLKFTQYCNIDSLITEVSHNLGYQHTGKNIRERLIKVLVIMRENGIVYLNGSVCRLA